MAADYEATRRRHAEYATGLLPEYLGRLRWSRAEVDAEQNRALRRLLRHASEHSPWHRARLAGLDVERLSRADLAHVPPMTKADLMAHWEEIVTDPRCRLADAEHHLAHLTDDAYFLDEYHVIASGGSSGVRGVFAYDWHGWAISWLGSARGLFEVAMGAGATGGTVASVSSHVATHATTALGQTFRSADRPFVRAPVTLPLPEIVAVLNHGEPGILHAYPSMLLALCEEARAGRLRIAPRVVFCTSEPLLPEVRAAAAGTWGALVLNTWASSESNGGAFSCAVGSGFHVGEDVNVIEPVDERGAPVPPGERSAKILVTNLYNRLLPLVRYEITDEFEVSASPCACGSAYAKVEDVHGRLDDVFDYPGGVRVHPLNLRSPLGKEPAITEYQVRQTARGADVDVVAATPFDAEALRASIEARLVGLGLRTPAVTVRRVDRIARQATGKLKRFVPLSPP
jgi:phenylacetate-coenzyme A ligase PaaK-like adenylate-forming protein